MNSLIVIGGGAAGLFAAIAARRRGIPVLVLEKSAVLLAKVRVSGGGRCNVTHACFDPKELVQFYPRGHKELLGPFHRFGPRSVMAWFEERGVPLKIENDNRVFPRSDSSESIIECLLGEARTLGVAIRMRQTISSIRKTDSGFEIDLGSEQLSCQTLILATGSSPQGHAWAKALGHTIEPPVPSLFTLNIPSSPLKELSGVCIDPATLSLPETPLSQTGPLLITHFGFSGPAALKLSAWGARVFHERGYKTPVQVNWLGSRTEEEAAAELERLKAAHPRQLIASQHLFGLPKSLLKQISPPKTLGECSAKDLKAFAAKLTADSYLVEGKTSHKEEFVTCGGVRRSEVDFRTMESKLCPGLRFAGEILDIDAVTGGFNFQNAWTTGFLAGS